jgi:hypothetical protein
MPTIKDKYRITQRDDNVTLSAGVANTETTIAKFVAPDRTAFEIGPDDIFSLYLADTTPTQLAATTQVKLTHEDPNGITIRQLTLVDYTVLTEFMDRLKLFTIGQSATVKPKDRLFIKVSGNLAADTASTRFQISTTRVAESLRI